MDKASVIRHMVKACTSILRQTFLRIRSLVLLMVSVSLGTFILDQSGLLGLGAKILAPMMHVIGLSGEAALVFINSIVFNLYAGAAVLINFSFTGREITILAVMSLLAHNLIMESAMMKKTGSSASKIVFIRIGSALISAWLLSLILPHNFYMMSYRGPTEAFSWQGLPNLLEAWTIRTLLLIGKASLLILSINIVKQVMNEFATSQILGKLAAPLLSLFGLPVNMGYIWITMTMVSLTQGSIILLEQEETGTVSLSDGDLFNHFTGISHSLLEDTILFMVLGVSAVWALVPRIVLASLVVWMERVRRVLFRRSFRIGTI